MMTDDLIQQAVSAYKRGQRNRARNLLLQFVETNQSNELAWLLLGDLYENPEKQITALEKALVINPENDRVRTHIKQLEATLARRKQEKLQEALAAKKDGHYDLSLKILRRLVDDGEEDEHVWLLISEIVSNRRSQIAALKTVIALNPNHAEAKMRLEDIQSVGNDPIALGMRYEKRDNLPLAIDLYQRVSRTSSSRIIRQEAIRRLNSAKIRLEEPEFKQVDPRLTLGRMTIGPIVLFSLLIFLHSGLNLLKIPLVLLLGWLCVVLGSFLIVLTDERSLAYLMHTIWKKTGWRKEAPLLGLKRLGILLIAVPFIVLSVDSLIRFQPIWSLLWK